MPTKKITDDFGVEWSFYPKSRCITAMASEGIPEELPCPWAHDIAATLRKHGRIALNTPPEGATTHLFAELHDTGHFYHIYESRVQVRMCGAEDSDVIPISAREQVGGGYWGWWDHESQAFTMIWPSRVQAEMCFPYGYKIEEWNGRGKLVELTVERAND